MVVKNKLALPVSGEWRNHHETHIFDASETHQGVRIALRFALLVKDEVLGTFTVGGATAGRLSHTTAQNAGRGGDQSPFRCRTAAWPQSLEERATTDGLTGLVNHRTFQERFSPMLGRADRHKFRVAFLLTDIDHFKKVNDTYGHPIGDAVLEAGRRHPQGQRAQDRHASPATAARNSPSSSTSTDRAGARQLAERIREEVGAQAFESSKGPFDATLSLGVAVYPDDSKVKQEIISSPTRRSTPPNTAAATVPSATAKFSARRPR